MTQQELERFTAWLSERGFQIAPKKVTPEMVRAAMGVSLDMSANQFAYGYQAAMEVAPKPKII